MQKKKMENLLYNKDLKELFFYDTLITHQFNDTASFIFEEYINNTPISKIAKLMSLEFGIEDDEAIQDVTEFIIQLKEMGIEPQKILHNSDQPFKDLSSYFRLHTPILHIIQNCNSPCKMCDCWQTKEKVSHPAKDLKKLFIKMKELGATSAMISGGEPLLHPELKQIIQDVKDLGIAVMLNTNALLLKQHNYLTDMEIEQLVISMDGTNPETYKEFRGLNGFEIVWNNLKEFHKKSPRTQIGIRTILNKHNFGKMDILFDTILSYGFHSVGLSPADISSDSFSRMQMNDSKSKFLKQLLLPSEDQIVHFLDTFKLESAYYQKIDFAHKNGLSSWSPNDFIRCMEFYLNIQQQGPPIFKNEPCFFPYTAFVLDYNGDLRNCFYSESFGNLYDFDAIDWSFKNSMYELEKSNKCTTCRGKVFCSSEKPILKIGECFHAAAG